MPQANNRVTGQQWDTCARCTFSYPIGSLTKQKGQLLCGKCLDNLEVERRAFEIERVLGNPNDREGSDLRGEYKSFFDGFDTEMQG